MDGTCNEGISWLLWLVSAPLLIMLWLMMAGAAMVWWRFFVNPGMGDGEIR